MVSIFGGINQSIGISIVQDRRRPIGELSAIADPIAIGVSEGKMGFSRILAPIAVKVFFSIGESIAVGVLLQGVTFTEVHQTVLVIVFGTVAQPIAVAYAATSAQRCFQRYSKKKSAALS